jgi:hypothetical protein
MRLDEEPLAGESDVRGKVLFRVLTALLPDIQLLCQLQWEILAQCDVQGLRVDVVCHDLHTPFSKTSRFTPKH